MANTTSSGADREVMASGSPLSIQIISPSPEVARLSFEDIDPSSTIDELKLKIQSSVPTKPAPQRQRLIYQGRALLKPQASLSSVLGVDTIKNGGTFTIHLALTPVASAPSSDTPRPVGLPDLPAHRHHTSRMPDSGAGAQESQSSSTGPSQGSEREGITAGAPQQPGYQANRFVTGSIPLPAGLAAAGVGSNPPTFSSLIAQHQHHHLQMQQAIMMTHQRAIRQSYNAAAVGNSDQTGQPAFPPNVFLLSSPSGYRALLISPEGTFRSPENEHPDRPSEESPGLDQLYNQEQPEEIVVDPNPPPAQLEEVDVFRILLPIGGWLWFAIRIIGFIWLFSGNAGWYRTIVISLCAFLFFVAQTGFLNPVYEAFGRPLRQHLEGLVQGDAVVRPPQAGAAAQRGQNNGSAELPSPENLADWQLLERQQRERNTMRSRLRRFERSMALFVASFVPGVGEQHVAARQAADAVRELEIARQHADLEREQERVLEQQRAAVRGLREVERIQERIRREQEQAQAQAGASTNVAAETTGTDLSANRAEGPAEPQDLP